MVPTNISDGVTQKITPVVLSLDYSSFMTRQFYRCLGVCCEVSGLNSTGARDPGAQFVREVLAVSTWHLESHGDVLPQRRRDTSSFLAPVRTGDDVYEVIHLNLGAGAHLSYLGIS